MNTLFAFTVEIAICLSLSTAVLLVLSPPLQRALNDLCPTERQAAFWLSYTRLMLFLAPLLLVLIINTMTIYNETLEVIRITLIATLVGLLIGLMIVGKRVFIPAARQCENLPEAQQTR